MSLVSTGELKSLAHFRNTPFGDFLIDFLTKRLAGYQQVLINAQDYEGLLRAQGKAQAVMELLSEINDAQNQLQRLAPRPKAQL